MPNNTDNSGSARAARLRQISAARGPIPVQRPNIGSMALDARIGGGKLRPTCCTTTEAPPAYPTYYLPCVDGSQANEFPYALPLPDTPFYLDAEGEPGEGLIQLTCEPSYTIILANTSLPFLVSEGIPDGTNRIIYVYLCSPIFLPVVCGIGLQALSPYIPYRFINNTSTTDYTVDLSGTVVLLLTDVANNTTSITIDAFEGTSQSYTNLAYWQSDISGATCGGTQYVEVFAPEQLGCITQVLNPAITYYFAMTLGQSGPLTFPINIYLERQSLPTTTITISGYDVLYGPYTNCTSWHNNC